VRPALLVYADGHTEMFPEAGGFWLLIGGAPGAPEFVFQSARAARSTPWDDTPGDSLQVYVQRPVTEYTSR
jgi:hypothetical protein